MFCCCTKKKNKSKETKSAEKTKGKASSHEKTRGSPDTKTGADLKLSPSNASIDPLATKDATLSSEVDMKGTMKKKDVNPPENNNNRTVEVVKCNDRTTDGFTTVAEKDDEIVLNENLKGYKFDNEVPLRNFTKWYSLVIQVYGKKIELCKDKEDFPVVTFREENDNVFIDIVIFNKEPVKFTAKKEKISLIALCFEYVKQAYSGIKTRLRNFKLVLEKGFDNEETLWEDPFFQQPDQFMNVSIYNRSDHAIVKITSKWLQTIPKFYTQCISLECIKCFNNGHLNSIHFRSIWISECEVTEKGIFQFIKNWIDTNDKNAYKHLRMDVSADMETKIMDNLKKNVPGAIRIKDDKEMEEKIKTIYKKIACKAAHDDRYDTKFDGFDVYFISKTRKEEGKEKKYVATIGVKNGVFEFCYCGDIDGGEDGADSIFTSFRADVK